jgi:hypothetical protein
MLLVLAAFSPVYASDSMPDLCGLAVARGGTAVLAAAVLH